MNNAGTGSAPLPISNGIHHGSIAKNVNGIINEFCLGAQVSNHLVPASGLL